MTTDTAPTPIRDMAGLWLYNHQELQVYLDGRACDACPEDECRCPMPYEWVEAAAMEAYTAFTETLDTFVETLIAGRPPTKPLVEWAARELIDIDDAKEIAVNQGHRYG